MSYLTSKTLFYRSCTILMMRPIPRMTIKHLTRRIMLQDHIGSMKVVTLLIRYINRNKTSLILMVMMCINGYTNAINTLI
jgi:hypothetical protein